MKYPSDEECIALLHETGTFPNIIEHCRAVQAVALGIYDGLAPEHRERVCCVGGHCV